MTTVLTVFSVFVLAFFTLTFNAYAEPTRPTLCGKPADNQILPLNDVVLRWNDSPNEHHYYMTIRNLNTDALIYNCYVVPQNSTSFTVPKSKLTYNTSYRWCVAAVDSSGVYKCADAVVFYTEAKYYTNTSSPHQIDKNDPHLYANGFVSTARLDYFVYASSYFHSTSYDSILQSAVNSWNGISSKVSFVRTATPADNKYELGIYEFAPPANDTTSFGTTIYRLGGMGSTIVYADDTYDFAEVHTYPQNICNIFSSGAYLTRDYHITDCKTYLKSNAMHEVGHALGLIHTSFSNYAIDKTKTTNQNIYLIMNQSEGLSAEITDVDKSHLKLKWGA